MTLPARVSAHAPQFLCMFMVDPGFPNFCVCLWSALVSQIVGPGCPSFLFVGITLQLPKLRRTLRATKTIEKKWQGIPDLIFIWDI